MNKLLSGVVIGLVAWNVLLSVRLYKVENDNKKLSGLLSATVLELRDFEKVITDFCFKLGGCAVDLKQRVEFLEHREVKRQLDEVAPKQEEPLKL